MHTSRFGIGNRALRVLIAVVALSGVVSSPAQADAGNGMKYRSDWYSACVNYTFGSASAALSCVASQQVASWHGSPENSGCQSEAGDTGEPGGSTGTSWSGTINNTGTHPCSLAPGGSCESCGYVAHWADHPGLYRTACTGTDFDPGGPCEPPPPMECDMSACPVGTRLTETGGAAEVCDTDCGCKLTLSGSTNGVNSYHNTGEGCSGSEDPPPEDLTSGPTDEVCNPVGDGEFCVSATGEGQCGYMNDSYVCLDRIKDNECAPVGGGGRLCGPDANTTPPAPDNGTPGQMAEPDGTVSTAPAGGDTTIINYFSGGTVAGSSRDPGADGGAPRGGSPHTPQPGDEDGDGEDDCSGGGCGPASDIESSGPCYSEGSGAIDALKACGTDAFNDVVEAFSESDFAVFVGELADSAPTGGSCPSATFDAFGETYDVGSVVCDLVEEAGTPLSLCFLVMWGWIGLRILLGAIGGGE